MSIRSHDQFNTTIYGSRRPLPGHHGGRRVVFLNEEDVAAAGLRDGDVVDLVSDYAGQVRTASNFIRGVLSDSQAMRRHLLP